MRARETREIGGNRIWVCGARDTTREIWGAGRRDAGHEGTRGTEMSGDVGYREGGWMEGAGI